MTGHGLSIFGDYAARTALTLFLLDRTGSAIDVSIMFIMNSLPAILGISSGYFSSRYSLKKLLIAYSLIGSFLSILMCVMTGVPALFYGIYVVFFFLGLINSLYVPTRIAFIAEIIEERNLRSFNSLDQTIEAVAMSGGIAASAFLYLNTGIQNVFVLNAVSFIAIVLTMLAVKSKNALSNSPLEKATPESTLKSTYHSIRKNQELIFLIIGVGLSGVAVGIFSTMFVVFIRQELARSAEVFSHLSSVRALVSSLIGFALALTWIKIEERRMIIFGYTVMGAAIIAMSYFNGLELLFLWNIIIGAANTFYFVAIRTQLQQKADKKMKTQIFALQSAIMRMSMVVSTGLSGFISDVFHIASSVELVFAGIIFLGIGFWGYLIYRPIVSKITLS
ncbi:MFS transporter [Paenibacillus macerans]|uniref:MFS transporter n=1 Tax=Paenibacillus macerans TaxID=44252 RepID=UPI002ECAACB8|nr:MFS transporter [Paenibacillus macerans]